MCLLLGWCRGQSFNWTEYGRWSRCLFPKKTLYSRFLVTLRGIWCCLFPRLWSSVVQNKWFLGFSPWVFRIQLYQIWKVDHHSFTCFLVSKILLHLALLLLVFVEFVSSKNIFTALTSYVGESLREMEKVQMCVFALGDLFLFHISFSCFFFRFTHIYHFLCAPSFMHLWLFIF